METQRVEVTTPWVKKREGTSRLQRVEKPCREAVKVEVSHAKGQISWHRRSNREISAIINEKKEEREKIADQIEEAMQEIWRLQCDFEASLKERNLFREQLNAWKVNPLDGSLEMTREESRMVRENLVFTDERRIDKEIKRINHMMEHTTISIQEERRMVKRIGELNKSRGFVQRYAAMRERALSLDNARAELVSKVQEKELLLDDTKRRKNEQRRHLGYLKGKEREIVLGVRQLEGQRSHSYKMIRELESKIKELWKEFWTSLREWEGQREIQLRLRFQRRR